MGYNNGVVTAPVSMGDISNALNYSSLDLGTLYSNGVIKVNSMYKPMRGTAIFGSKANGDLTDTERRAYDWGWGNLGVEDGLVNAMTRKVNGNGSWNVAIKQGSNAGYPYRMLDMDGYNKNADIPFKLSLANATDGYVPNTQPIRMIMADFYTELQKHLTEWGFMPSGTDVKKIGIGFYVKYAYNNVSANDYAFMLSAASTTQFTFDTIGENDEIKDFAISANFYSRLPYTTGTFDIIPFIIPDTSGLSIQATTQALRLGDYNGRVMTFHQDPLRVYLVAAANPIDLVNYEGVDSKSVSFTNYRISVSSLKLKITNNGSSSQSVTIQVAPDSAYIVGSMSGSFATKTITLAAGASQSVEMVTSAPSWETYNKTTYVDVTITIGSTSKVIDNVLIYSPKEE